MKAIIESTVALLLIATTSVNAQLLPGSIAPDWTLTDINGVSHNLYSDLNSGKTVFLDVSATWCSPCWTYHNSHALEDLWKNHGPVGAKGVLSTTTDDVVVYYIEGDGKTTSADLNGTGTNTQGNWVSGTDYYIIDPNATEVKLFSTDYQIAYFPTVYMICPNRVIKEVGQKTTAELYTEKGNCTAPATVNPDAALLTNIGTSIGCDEANLVARLQNNSTTPLTSCTIIAKQGTNTVASFPWVGNLTTYAYTDVAIGTFPISAPTAFTYSITTADAIASNNSIAANFNNSSLKASSSSVTIKITTDRYGSETKWVLKNSLGVLVSSGGPYPTYTVSGSFPQPDINLNLPSECYTFNITDRNGDGIVGTYGNGSVTLVSSGINIISLTDFKTNTYSNAFGVSTSISVKDNSSDFGIKIYPNPINNQGTVSFSMASNNYVSMSIENILGQSVSHTNMGLLPANNHSYSIDASGLNGGIYFLKMNIGEQIITKKIIVGK
jgi:hypothetical protein